jgi:hypothetical protein
VLSPFESSCTTRDLGRCSMSFSLTIFHTLSFSHHFHAHSSFSLSWLTYHMSCSKVQNKERKIPCMKSLNKVKKKELKMLEVDAAKRKSQIIKLEPCHLAKSPISPSPMLKKENQKKRDQANKRKRQKRGSKKKRLKEW